MLKNFFRYFISSLFFLIATSLSANAELKVGFVYVGPTGDHGWTYQHHEGRNGM